MTRRIPSEQADALARVIEGRKDFEKLAQQFIEATVGLTRSEAAPGSKKRDEIRAAVQQETAEYVEQFLNQPPVLQQQHTFERTFQELICESAGRLLPPTVQALADPFDASFQTRPGQRLVLRGSLEITRRFGAMTIRRNYHWDGPQGQCPAEATQALEAPIPRRQAR